MEYGLIRNMAIKKYDFSYFFRNWARPKVPPSGVAKPGHWPGHAFGRAQTTKLYKREKMLCHAYKCSNLARKMRIRLEATSVGIGTDSKLVPTWTATARILSQYPLWLYLLALGYWQSILVVVVTLKK